MNRAEFTDAVREQAFDAGKTCPTCRGDGVVRPGRRVVHCAGSFTGADWDEASVIAEIENAREVRWLPNGIPGGHNLAIVTDEGREWRFQVTDPANLLPEVPF